MPKILILNGPNLNLLGEREPEIYGSDNLHDINQHLSDIATTKQYELCHFQSNAEHQLVEQIQNAKKDAISFIIINPAAFTHTSIALRDAFSAVEIPFIEIHLSNIHARENFRKHSYLSDIAHGVIFGLGVFGYELALLAAIKFLQK